MASNPNPRSPKVKTAPLILPSASHPPNSSASEAEKFQWLALYRPHDSKTTVGELLARGQSGGLTYQDEVKTMQMLYAYQQEKLMELVRALKSQTEHWEKVLQEENDRGVSNGIPALFDEEIWTDIKRFVETRCKAAAILEALNASGD